MNSGRGQFGGRLNVRNLPRAFANGFRGIGALLSTQPNSRVHLGATIAVVALGLWVGIGPSDWALLSIAIAAVWTAEAFNTALEFLSDAGCPGRNPLVGRAKDVAAGAVIFASIGAVAVGLFVFVPVLFR